MDYIYLPGSNRYQQPTSITQNNRTRQGHPFQQQQQQPRRNNQLLGIGSPSLSQIIPSPLSSSYSQTNQFNFPLRSNRNFSNHNHHSKKYPTNRNRIQPVLHEQPEVDDISPSSNLNDMNGNSNQGLQANNRNENAGTGSNVAPAVVQPQYRIFKRGDTIPGISSPLSLASIGNHNSVSNGTNSLNGNVEVTHQDNNAEPNKFTECFNGSADASIVDQIHSNESTDSDGNSQRNQRGSSSSNRTPISLIADIARFHGIKAEYRLTNETGPPHAPTFTVVLSLGNEQYQSQGPSIKKAQLAAATMAVEKTSLKPPPPRAQPKKAFHAGGGKRSNWTILQLNSLAEELNEKITFTSQPVQILNPFNKVDPPSLVVVNVGDQVFTGEGHNISIAKNNAALSALKALVQLKQERELAKMLENSDAANDECDPLDSEIKSPISIIHEMALKRGLKVSFEIKDEQGPPHMKVFTILCEVGALETEGQGPTKQHAKKVASELMMTKLKEIPMKQPKVTSLKSIQSGVLKTKPKVPRKKPATPVIKEVDKQIVSPISRLLQIAHVKKYKEPEFALVVKPNESAEAAAAAIKNQDRRNNRKKKPFFTMQVTVGPYVCQGSGSNKKMAKKAAADAALVMLGYAPTEVKENNKSTCEKKERIEETTVNSLIANAINETTNKKSADLKITAARQIVPGLLVINSESKDSTNSSASPATAAQEMIKVNSMPSQPTTFKTLAGIGKLAYLAELLEISVSYSDFPKKNEFLSVASLGTNPPHVAHGIGPTREEAQNSAAVQILEELSTSGLDSVTTHSSNTI